MTPKDTVEVRQVLYSVIIPGLGNAGEGEVPRPSASKAVNIRGTLGPGFG
jgi:hypothetical protein